jgi:hypothetical protein
MAGKPFRFDGRCDRVMAEVRVTGHGGEKENGNVEQWQIQKDP